METKSLSNLQLELLKVYSRQIEDEDVIAIRKMLATYFAEKAIRMADEAWVENGWKSVDTQRLSQEHNRTSTGL
ncbi:hypothetical protein MUK70_14070 [Dyadobacter chenwenxiniae]|uniref:Uncharacterized protein n=1 Tax=Dyadobacter chenwenxiniae TaxID=2906456 RepID=A0A9X1TDH9_9BACT|nr:hypothetical protein [Dyadobacter chenwenxiniae]MCF0053465.1 hypothetical protein [Dyadobacter chenwenxiniae]MCF0060370.1 hypothetical protein [Dyadobacter chenwenxiniae]UON86103.1 hypothetical protein MUK70_14070 [Dyadobacter chenwenxiniae]